MPGKQRQRVTHQEAEHALRAQVHANPHIRDPEAFLGWLRKRKREGAGAKVEKKAKAGLKVHAHGPTKRRQTPAGGHAGPTPRVKPEPHGKTGLRPAEGHGEGTMRLTYRRHDPGKTMPVHIKPKPPTRDADTIAINRRTVPPRETTTMVLHRKPTAHLADESQLSMADRIRLAQTRGTYGSGKSGAKPAADLSQGKTAEELRAELPEQVRKLHVDNRAKPVGKIKLPGLGKSKPGGRWKLGG